MEKLSIIVVTMNSAGFIPACFASVFCQQATFPCEVIAVDNASVDGSADVIAGNFPQVHLIRNSANEGFQKANNRGIRASSGTVVLLLNPDTELKGHALEEMMKFLAQHPDVAVVGPKILNGDGTLQRTGVSFPSLWNTLCESLFLDLVFPHSRIFGRHRRLYKDPGAAHEIDYAQGSCLMVKRGALEEAGLLDEEYFLYFDEAELCWTLKESGWKVMYIPDAAVTHFGGSGTTFYDEMRLGWFYESYILFLKKHFGVIRQQLFRVVLLWRAFVRIGVFSAAGVFTPARGAEFAERARAYRRAASLLLKFK